VLNHNAICPKKNDITENCTEENPTVCVKNCRNQDNLLDCKKANFFIGEQLFKSPLMNSTERTYNWLHSWGASSKLQNVHLYFKHDHCKNKWDWLPILQQRQISILIISNYQSTYNILFLYY
jgi:hypothetical protein